MPDLLVLGTAASVPDAEQDAAGLALRGPEIPADNPIRHVGSFMLSLDTR